MADILSRFILIKTLWAWGGCLSHHGPIRSDLSPDCFLFGVFTSDTTNTQIDTWDETIGRICGIKPVEFRPGSAYIAVIGENPIWLMR